jgi:hypothetical protein
MRTVFTTLLRLILILLAVAVAIFLLSLGFVGMGWLLSRILPLSLFEASVIALLSGLGLAYVIGQIISIPIKPTYYDEDWEDEEDWDEEDWEEDEYEEPISFPQWRRRGDRSADVPVVGRNDPCPCGSGKKYKYCHGRKESQ